MLRRDRIMVLANRDVVKRQTVVVLAAQTKCSSRQREMVQNETRNGELRAGAREEPCEVTEPTIQSEA